MWEYTDKQPGDFINIIILKHYGGKHRQMDTDGCMRRETQTHKQTVK
jgi:hypothetical protein